jgi:short-subunit dehydrogenase
MHFEAKKVIVVGGSAGMGRQVAIDVVDHGGSVVTVGRSKARVDNTAAELTRTRHRNDNPPAANAEPSREGTRK